MKGWVRIDLAGLGSDSELAEWVDRGTGVARRLPPKDSQGGDSGARRSR